VSDVQAASVDGASASEVPPPRELIEFIFKFCTTYDRFTGQMRRAFGLNAHERLALAMLWERGPMTMSDLGAWIPLSRAAVTTLVDRLEDAGLVARGTDPVDRRRTVVRHTELSETRMAPVIGDWAASMVGVADAHAEHWPVIAAFLTDFRSETAAAAEMLVNMSDVALRKLAATGTPSAVQA
jgi:DNA-binding MarR family transcriptional regulator